MAKKERVMRTLVFSNSNKKKEDMELLKKIDKKKGDVPFSTYVIKILKGMIK
jgi:hypothetical protein